MTERAAPPPASGDPRPDLEHLRRVWKDQWDSDEARAWVQQVRREVADGTMARRLREQARPEEIVAAWRASQPS